MFVAQINLKNGNADHEAVVEESYWLLAAWCNNGQMLPPTHDEEYLDILGWMADYKACDTLQMHCTVGERFGEL